MDLSATFWPLKTTSSLVDTGSDISTPHRYLGFLKYPNFKGWKGQEGENASPCQISRRSVKPLLRFDYFSMFPKWRQPPSWICNARIWTIRECHLVMFITVQNLVGIDTVVLTICKF